MSTENDNKPEATVRCTSVAGDASKLRANKEWEEGPECAFLQWCDKRGVWPRRTHQEAFLAGWELRGARTKADTAKIPKRAAGGAELVGDEGPWTNEGPRSITAKPTD